MARSLVGRGRGRAHRQKRVESTMVDYLTLTGSTTATDTRRKTASGEWIMGSLPGVQMDLRPVAQLLDRLGTAASGAIAAGCYQAAWEVMTKWSIPEVPVDSGALVGSAFVEDPVVSGSTTSVTVGYGGPAIGYALHVHEDLNARHRPPTKAKYLEDPVRAHEIDIRKRITSVVLRAVERL